MKWFNEPAVAKPSGDQLVVTSKSKTDFWRKTFYDYVTDNGHFFFLPVAGDFTFECRVAGKYAALYDQVGLMARLDGSNWLKCGLELVDGIGHASVVVTREYSDWSRSAESPRRTHSGGAWFARLISRSFVFPRWQEFRFDAPWLSSTASQRGRRHHVRFSRRRRFRIHVR